MALLDAWRTLDICLAAVTAVSPFPAARKPAYQLQLSLGSTIGTRQSSAQLVTGYPSGETSLKGRWVFTVANFGERKIAGFKSQVLVLGFVGDAEKNRLMLMQIFGDSDNTDMLEPGMRVRLLGEEASGSAEPLAPQAEFHSFEEARILAGTLLSSTEIDVGADKSLTLVTPVPDKQSRAMLGKKVVVLPFGNDTGSLLSINGHLLTMDEPETIPNGTPLS